MQPQITIILNFADLFGAVLYFSIFLELYCLFIGLFVWKWQLLIRSVNKLKTILNLLMITQWQLRVLLELGTRIHANSFQTHFFCSKRSHFGCFERLIVVQPVIILIFNFEHRGMTFGLAWLLFGFVEIHLLFEVLPGFGNYYLSHRNIYRYLFWAH